MKRNNKKGFTIVELVIVIAVIAILAGVLIPTFAGVTAKAKQSAVLQEATNKYKEAYALDMSDGKLDGNEGKTAVADTNYSYDATAEKAKYTFTKDNYTATFNGTEWTVAKAANAG